MVVGGKCCWCEGKRGVLNIRNFDARREEASDMSIGENVRTGGTTDTKSFDIVVLRR